jgi:hypothetical protein
VEVGAFRKVKRWGYRGTLNAYLLGDDEFGSWSFVPAGSSVRHHERGVESVSVLHFEPGFLRLVPPTGWWVASWWPQDGGGVFVYVDICTPRVFEDNACTWTDLELDVLRSRDGAVRIDDEDEFEEANVAGYHSAADQREARAATTQLVALLRGRIPPFDDTGLRKFHEAASLGLSPLDAPPFV